MKLYKYLVIIVLCVVGFTGCGDKITEEYYTGTMLHNEYIIVEKDANKWWWDEDLESYVYSFDIPKLTKGIYDDGTVVASVFVDPETDHERMELLPFLFTYWAEYDDGTLKTYTENVNCSIQPGVVTFYIQASDRNDGGVKNDYQFKVSLIGDASLFR
ncbi:hypothetical protein [Dysgonomonas reticulitermitis]